MKTAVETIYNFFENHDERMFLDFLRENKRMLLDMEKAQSYPQPPPKVQVDPSLNKTEPNVVKPNSQV
jgi:hypothetical protein